MELMVVLVVVILDKQQVVLHLLDLVVILVV
jgi:hypothetical protein